LFKVIKTRFTPD